MAGYRRGAVLTLATFVLLTAGGCEAFQRAPRAAWSPATRSPTPTVSPTAPATTRPWAKSAERAAIRAVERARRTPTATPTPKPAATRATTAGNDGLDPLAGTDGWASWALLDRRTGRLRTGGDSGTNTTESMVKAWIAADYLRGLGLRDPDGSEVDLLSRMIRDSDDQAAQTLYLRRGGDAVIRRLVATCGLTDTRLYAGWWSLTRTSARDAARMGACLADGRAMGPKWTAWLLGEMRQVRGEGRFGIAEVYPVPIKNGWTRQSDGNWHVNCLAVAGGWTLSVLTRYPARLGLAHGAELCRAVAREVVPHP
jgi:hypothetical protein